MAERRRQRTRRLTNQACVFCGRANGHDVGCVNSQTAAQDQQERSRRYTYGNFATASVPWFWAEGTAPTASFMATASHMVTPNYVATEWRNEPERPYHPTLIGNQSTWDFDAGRSLWRRRSDGHCVTTLALHDTGCRNIIEFEERYLRDGPRAVVVNSPDGTMSVNEFQRVQEEVRRAPPGTRVEVRLGRNDVMLGRTDTPCESCDHDPCDCYWTTRDGTRVRVVAMDDGHIWNALRAAQRRGGRYLEDNPRYRPLIREARRRGWYGGVPPLRVADEVARPDPIEHEEPVVKREPYQQGKRLIKL